MSKIVKDGGFYKCENYYSYLKNPEKYIREDKKVTARSGLEIDYFKKFDNNKNILEWNSENIAIPYMKPTFNKYGTMTGMSKRNYYPDIYIKIRNKQGNIEEVLGEIKPKKQIYQPKLGKRKTEKGKKNFINEKIRWFINISKWDAAGKVIENIRKRHTRNIRFMLLTEDEIFDWEIIKKELKI